MRVATGTGLRLAARGLWFRRSTALIVLVLATVASAASVVAPLYARAAEESILRDTLRSSDAFSLAAHVSVPTAGTGEGLGDARSGRFTARVVERQLSHPAFGAPQLSYSTAGVFEPRRGRFAGSTVVGQAVQRPRICEHLPVVAGRCPAAADEGMVSRRSLPLLGARIGDTVQVTLENALSVETGRAPVIACRIVGVYDPVPVEGTYWVGRPYFSVFYPDFFPDGLDVRPPTADPVFFGPGTAEAVDLTAYTIDVPVLPGRVRLEDVETLTRQVEGLRSKAQSFLLTTESQLPAALGRADEGRDLVRIAAPLAVTQLVLLSWWTLFLVVGSATEERSAELGLAKLRGLTARQTRAFGLAEVLLLLVVAAPLGTALGYLAVRSAADRVFAPGTHVVMTWSVLLTVLVALAGGVVTAALASRQVLRRPVSELLRRVPSRAGGRRVGLVEAVVVVLAVAGLVQLVADRGGPPSPVALLGPGLVAVAGGLLAARMLVRTARRRAAAATERGRAPALAGWAAIARRPGTPRIAAVLAVATCLLLVGVQAWSVAERNRHERAAVETGAAVVLTVRTADPRAVLDALAEAEPTGRYAMAAVEVRSSSQEPSLLAVDSSRADRIMQWGPPDARPSTSVRRALHPPLPGSITVRPGRLAVTVDLRSVDSPSPLRLTARLEHDGAPLPVMLGHLRRGVQTYDGSVPDACVDGCRLAALGVDHPSTDIASARASLVIRALSTTAGQDRARERSAGFAVPGAWRPPAPVVGGPEVRVRPGEGLQVDLTTPGGLVAEIVRGDAPEPLPALAGRDAAGPPPAQGGSPVADTTGVSGELTRYLTGSRVATVPALGPDAVLVDLQLALRLSDTAPAGERQVWLGRDDPRAERRLVAALREAGIPVTGRESLAALERSYAGDGAVLALRLLLVCGAAAVVVAVGALLVAAYVGRRQRAYEVAALRAVGLKRRTVRRMLLRENLGTVGVALLCGAAAAALTTWVVLPSLPQFDTPSEFLPVRYSPDLPSGWGALGGLAAVLVVVGGAVAVVQLRTGRPERLREGVR